MATIKAGDKLYLKPNETNGNFPDIRTFQETEACNKILMKLPKILKT